MVKNFSGLFLFYFLKIKKGIFLKKEENPKLLEIVGNFLKENFRALSFLGTCCGCYPLDRSAIFGAWLSH
jgi:hypothetical protein